VSGTCCLPASSLPGNNDRLRIMFCSSRALLRSACPIRVWNGIFAAGDCRAKNDQIGHAVDKEGAEAIHELIFGVLLLGTRRDHRTWDPLMNQGP